MCNKHLDKTSEMLYNNTVEFQRQMYQVYDNQQVLRGTFHSIYDMEKYIDSIRNDRQESYPKTDRSSPFDYIKQIGWYWDIVPIE